MYWRLPEFEYRLSAVVKDILVSVSWVAVVWILGTAGNVKVVIPLISLMLFRGLILGLKELETDRILQRETITSNLGEKRSLWLGLFLVVISIISMYLAGFAIWVMFTTIILLYILALVVAFVRTRRGTYIEIFTDGIIILCALFLLL
jgi:4-hydroxybenzoate polyprenyltransferase